MKTNTEVVEELMAYFKEHADFESISRALANCMIDLNRFLYIEKLQEDEQECLIMRTQKNVEELHNFLRHGSKKKFDVKNVTTGEEDSK